MKLLNTLLREVIDNENSQPVTGRLGSSGFIHVLHMYFELRIIYVVKLIFHFFGCSTY